MRTKYFNIKSKKLKKAELLEKVEEAKEGFNQIPYSDILSHLHLDICCCVEKFKFIDGYEEEDIYLIAMDKLTNIINTYDEEKGAFVSFAVMGIENILKTEATRQNADKRKTLNKSYSITKDKYGFEPYVNMEHKLNYDLYKKDVIKLCNIYLSKFEKKVFLKRFFFMMTYKEIIENEKKNDAKRVDNALSRIRSKKKFLDKLIDLFSEFPDPKIPYKSSVNNFYPDGYDSYDPDCFGSWSLGIRILEER